MAGRGLLQLRCVDGIKIVIQIGRPRVCDLEVHFYLLLSRSSPRFISLYEFASPPSSYIHPHGSYDRTNIWKFISSRSVFEFFDIRLGKYNYTRITVLGRLHDQKDSTNHR